jgi:hypothetical protein
MTDKEIEPRLRRSRQLATLLDGAWGIPHTPWRFGIDALLGLLPVAGDLLSALLGLGIVWQARKLDAPTTLQVKMLGNIGLDFLLGSVPVIGDIADVAFRKNIRNAKLLEDWVAAAGTQ